MGGDECFRLAVSKFVQGLIIEVHFVVKGCDAVVDRVILDNFVCSFIPMNLYEMV